MGPTGSGKTTFVNLVSGSGLGIGKGLQSCTSSVQPGKPFKLDGRNVLLLDTPGFDDTTRGDVDILKMIALFLAKLHENRRGLIGVLYFHRISDFRMGGTAVKNIKMFRKLCGDAALKNVVVVTNMWEEVKDPQVGEAREAELKEKDAFFKPVLDKGARMVRHDNSATSARGIIRLLLENQPLPLFIQTELVDQGKDLRKTAAGREINRELDALARKHEEEMREIREEMEQAMNDRDEQAREELEGQEKKLREEMERRESEAEKLASDFKKDRERLEVNLKQMEEEAKARAARFQAEIDRLKAVLKNNAATSAQEKAQMEEEIRGLSRERDSSNSWLGPLFGIGLAAAAATFAIVNPAGAISAIFWALIG